MTKIWRKIFTNSFALPCLLLLLMIIYGLITYLTKIFIQTDELLTHSLSNKLSQKQVEYIIESSHKKEILTSILSSFYVPISTLIISAIIMAGIFFMSLKVKFLDIFKIVAVGEIIVLLQESLKFLWFYSINSPSSLIELKNFVPLSFQNFFSFQTLQSWQVTMLSISVFDFLFVLVLAKGLQYRTKSITLEKSFLLVALTYGVALFLYLALKIVLIP